MNRHPWPAIWVSTCLALFVGCGQEPTFEKPLTPVTVRTLEIASVKGGTRYSASLSPGTQVDLSFKVGGYVKDVHLVRGSDGKMRLLQAGDRVQQGAVLARLRESDFVVKLNQAKSNEADATANFNQAKLDFERAENLLATKSLTQSDYDAARARYESAQAKLRGAVESRKEADISVQDSSLKAPMDGVILKRNVEVGSLVSVGAVAFVLADISVVKALFGVPDIMVQHLTLGRKLSIATEAIPGAEFEGQITKVDPSADPTSRVFQIEIKIPNPGSRLKPGMIASVPLAGDQDSATYMTVPLSAIVRPPGRDTGYALFVVDAHDGTAIARLRPVQLGPVFGNTVIVTEGVKQGETIIVKGTMLIVDGEQVRILHEAG